MPEVTIADCLSMLSSQRDYCRWLAGHPCRWFAEQQAELLAEIEQAYQQLTAEL